MAKFNTATARASGRGPIASEAIPSGSTFQGAPGYARDAKSELFLLAVTNMVGENTFYESASDRDSRFTQLVKTVAVEDLDWLTRFGAWLRGEANMRSAALVLAAEGVKAALDAEIPGSRALVAAVLPRADEPGELVAYWQSRYGRALPKPLKRGIADAAAKLYGERNVLKYDTDSHGVRFADVVRLTHVRPRAEKQSSLFAHTIGKRIGVADLELPESLSMLRCNASLRALSAHDARQVLSGAPDLDDPAEMLAQAGVTWEAVPSLVDGPWTRELWEAVIPSMGYMALLRNLRNFDQAGVSDKVAAKVAARLADPDAVAKSRQLPMRFLSAYNAAPSLRWAYPLEQALDLSLASIPEMAGSTLVLVDTSASMDAGFSKDGSLHRWDAATLFGVALARRASAATVVSYSAPTSGRYWVGNQMRDLDVPLSREFPTVKGESVLKSVERWRADGYFLGGNTDTAAALRKHYSGQDRVVLLTDEQTSGGDAGAAVPARVPLYTWNLAGYQRGHAADGPNRYTFGGLTDQCFRMIPLLEQGRNAAWPF